MRVGSGLEDILALDIETLEAAIDRRIEHVGDPKPRLAVERNAPEGLEHGTGRIIGNMAVAGKLMGERPPVAGTLDVVLPAERIDAHTAPAGIARRHREVPHAPDRGPPPTVLGHAEAIIDRGPAA